ncbi:hypothetical protein ACGFNV_22130 [Streptomyces sp. NPDC048751]|uniref:hypothetical protein n=1 Tax=Streptomyces sp. NPDC048751 TaxID=3365591 RepID=UPI0037167BA8
MVSARRAARAGLDRVPSGDDAPPAWFWRFRWTDWGFSGPPSKANPLDFTEVHKARSLWHRERGDWMHDRGYETLQQVYNRFRPEVS